MGQKPSCHESRLLPDPGATCWSPGAGHLLTLALDRRPEQLPGACRPNLGGAFSAYATYVDLSGVTRENVASGSNPRLVPDGHGGLHDFGDFGGGGEEGEVVRYRDIMPYTPVGITLAWSTKKGDGNYSQTFFYKGERIFDDAAAAGDDNSNPVEDTTVADGNAQLYASKYPKCQT